MKNPINLLLLCLAFTQSITASPIGTAITYQGQLQDSGSTANGCYDLRFSLFDNLVAGNQVGLGVTNMAVAVSNGYFLATIDFGPGAFSSNALWLAIGVRTNGATWDFNTLTPRQPLTPVPFALFGSVLSTITSITNITNYTSVTTINSATNLSVNSVTAQSITGNGAGLTNLNANNLSAPVPISRGGTGATTASGVFANLMPSIYDGGTDDPNADGTVALGAGQLCITKDGFLYYATGAGQYQWSSLYNFKGGVGWLGSPNQMSPLTLGPTKFYTMGYPQYQTSNYNYMDAQVVQVNCNPYDSGSGWVCALVGTNANSYGYLSTTADGIPVYMQDAFALSLLITPLQAEPGILPGIGQIVMNGCERFALTSAIVYDGLPGNYSYFQTDPCGSKLHFMQWNGGVYNWDDSASSDIMTVDYAEGNVSIPKLTTKAVQVNGTSWLSGSGSPEGSVTAGIGSIYTRTDGGPGSTLYVKESGTGNTGWTAK